MSWSNRVSVLQGGLAVSNPFPRCADSSGFQLEGWYAPENRPMQARRVLLNSDILQNGLLVLGSAGSGKTNVINRLTDQILSTLGDDDFAVVLDVKGDYQRVFREDGDWVLRASSDEYAWNLFEDLLPFLGNRLLFDQKVHEMCRYLFAGRESSQQPFFVNAARDVTSCLLRYMIYEADSSGDYSRLNNRGFVELLRGQDLPEGCADVYEAYRYVLESYEEFGSGLAYLPPADQRNPSGDGVLSEVVSMANDMFSGAFGSEGRKGSISAARLLREKGGRVLFLSYDPALGESSSYAFRLLLDWILSSVSTQGAKFGKAYFILDEMAVLPKLQYLDRTLNLTRSQGVSIIGALQNTAQMSAFYSEAQANTILDAFQSLIVLRSETASIRYVKKRFGSALVQREYGTEDGGLKYQQPQVIDAVTDYQITGLPCGGGFVRLRQELPFRFRFARYSVQ